MLSDRSTLRWGRRRPFILVGTLVTVVGMLAIGASPGYWFLFWAAVLAQMGANVAHGAGQGLIPDLVPKDRRGIFSGVKSLMDLLPAVIVVLIIAKLIAAGQVRGGVLVAVGILFLSMVITMFVREEPLRVPSEPLDWEPFGRLVAMTGIFTAVILGLGATVKAMGKLLADTDSMPVLLGAMGLAGLLAMVGAIVVGVWTSVRVSIGSEEARRYPSYSWWVVNRLAFLVGVNNLAGFAIYFLQARLGLEAEAAVGPALKLITVVGVLILVCVLPSGWLADRIGRKRLVMLSGITAALGTLVFVLTSNMTVILAGGCIIGAATGVFFASNWALGTELVPANEAGRFLGISNLAGAGAGAVGAYIGGPVADFFTVHVPELPGIGYLVIFAVYGVLFLLSVVVMQGVKEQIRR
jgi:MFS family permease